MLLLIPSSLISQTGRLLKRAFRFGYIQHETLVQQVIKDRDVRLWKSIMGTSSHPLQDLLLPLKNRALRGRSHPYQILIKTTIQPLFISRKLNEDLKFREVKPAIVNQQCLVYQFQCNLCDAGYVGYTRGHLHERVDGHTQKSSSICKHYLSEHN